MKPNMDWSDFMLVKLIINKFKLIEFQIIIIVCTTSSDVIAQDQNNIFGPNPTPKEAVADNVSLPSGYVQAIQSAPSVTSVITAQQIKNMGAHDIYDVLRTVPGFYLSQNTSSIEPIIVVRGFWSAFNQNILVLLDNVPQTNYISGDRFAVLGQVPLDIIERIEIIRGPGSALYGADAYSATINIITRQIPPEKTQVAVRGGSQRERDARLLGGGHAGDYNIVGALEYKKSDGNKPFIKSDAQTTLDSLFGTRASLAPGQGNTNQQLFGAQLNISDANESLSLYASLNRKMGLGAGLAGALDPDGYVDTDTINARYEWSTSGKDWSTKILFNEEFYQLSLNDAHYYPPSAFDGFPNGIITSSKTRQLNTRLQATLEYTGFLSHHLNLGVGIESGQVKQVSESRNYAIREGFIIPFTSVQTIEDPRLLTFGGDTFSQDLQFIYLQDEWNVAKDLAFTGGFRYDHYSDYGDQFSPRLALIWDTTRNLTTKFIYGQGFRAPSLVDTSTQQGLVIMGNPNLKPERIESFEIAFDYRIHRDLVTRLNLFYQKTDDQIRLLSDGGLFLMPQNVARQIGRGGELEIRWDFDRYTQIYGSYSYQNNHDETTDTDIGYGPHNLFFVSLQRDQRPWFLSIEARYAGQRDRSFTDPRSPTKPYTVIDGLIRYEVTPDLEVGLEIRNLLDTDAVDDSPGTAFPSDIPLPGRTFYFSIGGRF